MKNNLLVEKLEVDNCEILLDKAESLYLTEEIISLKNNNSLNINSVKSILKVFKENNVVNYYSNKDIKKIAENLLNNVKKNKSKKS